MVFEKVLQGQRRHALAAAGFADNAHDLSFSDGEADAVDHLIFAAVFIQRHGHVLHFQNIFAHLLIPFCFQLRYFFRMPSPIQLSPTIVRTIMAPGASAAQGVEKMMSCASFNMRPQLGIGG